MKLFWTLYILLFWKAFAFGQDLPNPAANLQTMPTDSYIIPMDNTWQSTTGPTATYRNFNLKAYGLVVHLLNNNIKVKRVIRSGKIKEGIDFSVACQQVMPTAEATYTWRDFKAGPFVIFGSDLFRVNIDQLIEQYNNNSGGVSGIGHDTAKVRVYKTVSDVTVDVRHDLSGFKPQAAVLTDGGNADVHLTYYTLAGIPSSNYTTGANSDLAVNCFTFASEPHNDYQDAAVVNNIKAFVNAGGNFLAQCAAITNYEQVGRFQSSAGITVTNVTPAAVYFPNADVSFGQIEGGFSMRQGGSCQNWRYGLSAFANQVHAFATNTNGFVNNTSLIGASASKLTPSSEPGGMVYYLGNHSYSNINDYNHLNGIRMYMNAFLSPGNVKNVLRYSYNADCNAKAMRVASYNGPATAYPVQFNLYEDKGTVKGVVDPADPFVGATSVYSPGMQAAISLYNSDPNADYVMNVVPSASCYKPMEVAPSPCRFIVLSASLKNFTAHRNGENVLLRWQTFTEVNSRGFYIQQLVGDAWQDIGFVPSAAPSGNSLVKLSYQFVTHAPEQNTVQYRIAFQSVDQSEHYSDVRVVPGITSSYISVYPNPSSTGEVNINFPDESRRSILVYDLAGRKVRTVSGYAKSSLTFSKLYSGTYLIVVTDAVGTTQSIKCNVSR